MPDTPNGRASLASLEATVGGLSNTIAEMSRRFEHFATDVYSKLGQRGVAPGTWLGVVSIVITIAGMVLGAGAIWTSQRISPVEESIHRIERTIEKDRRDGLANDKDLRVETKESRLERREELRLIREEARAERAAIIAEFKEVRNAIVPRGEHEQRWAAQTAAVMGLDRRLDETRKTLSEIYSPQDAFKELQRQINELRQLVLSGPQPPPKP